MLLRGGGGYAAWNCKPVTESHLDILADRVDSMVCHHCSAVLDVRDLPSFDLIACPECEHQQTVPAQFGSFLLVSLLGKGGMGSVYKALDQSLNRYVAIKVMRQEFGDDNQFLKSFLHEAQSAAALNHRHVAHIYSFGQEHGQPYIVMELVEGGKLDEIIEQDSPLSETWVMKVMIEITEGLAYAHGEGLTHHDIKPANILFTPEHVAKVVDFGLSSTTEKQKAMPGEIWGTPFYIPPEKVGLKSYDHRADIYSLGGTFYHALAGEPPFNGDTAADVVKARLGVEPPDVRKIREDVTAETARVLMRMMAEQPGRRYPTYASLLADLRRAYEGARQAEKAKRAAAAVDAAPTARMPLLPFGLVVLLLIGAGAWWWSTREPPEPERKIVGYRLVSGKKVPIYEDEQEVIPDRGPGTNQTGTTEQDPPPPPDQPAAERFEATTERILGVEGLLLDGAFQEAFDNLQPRYDELKELDDPDRHRVALVQAIAALLNRRPADAKQYVADVPAVDAANGAQRAIGLAASRVAGDLGLDAYAEGSGGSGASALGPLTEAFRELEAGRYADAAARLGAVGQADPGSMPPWLVVFRKPAEALKAEVDWWIAFEDERATMVPAQVVEELRTRQAVASPYLKDVIGKEIAAVEAVIEAMRAEAAAVEQAALEAVQAEDTVLIDEAVVGRVAFIKRRDFAGAEAAMAKIQDRIRSDAGWERFLLEKDRVDRLAAMHGALIKALSANPPRQAIADLNDRRIARADRNAVYFASVDGGGNVPWAELSPRIYLKLAQYGIQNGGGDEAQQAEQHLALAIYCYESQATRFAEKFFAQAVALDAGLEETGSKLMPGLAGGE